MPLVLAAASLAVMALLASFVTLILLALGAVIVVGLLAVLLNIPARKPRITDVPLEDRIAKAMTPWRAADQRRRIDRLADNFRR